MPHAASDGPAACERRSSSWRRCSSSRRLALVGLVIWQVVALARARHRVVRQRDRPRRAHRVGAVCGRRLRGRVVARRTVVACGGDRLAAAASCRRARRVPGAVRARRMSAGRCSCRRSRDRAAARDRGAARLHAAGRRRRAAPTAGVGGRQPLESRRGRACAARARRARSPSRCTARAGCGPPRRSRTSSG